MIDEKTRFEAVSGEEWSELLSGRRGGGKKKVGVMGSSSKPKRPFASKVDTTDDVHPDEVYLNAHDAPDQHVFLKHYYHFLAENLVGGITGLATVTLPTGLGSGWSGSGNEPEWEEQEEKDSGYRAENLIIPWVEDYRDGAGMNEVVAEGLFPGRE